LRRLVRSNDDARFIFDIYFTFPFCSVILVDFVELDMHKTLCNIHRPGYIFEEIFANAMKKRVPHFKEIFANAMKKKTVPVSQDSYSEAQ
jgi:hypothetical protein